MDASEISQVMQDKGLASDPAFIDLNFIIGTLPNIPPYEAGHVLGLYYPNGKPTIALPRDADKSTLLHEVGHRYGHYYYGDTTEPFAESFRKKYDSGGRVFFFSQSEYFSCPDCETRFRISSEEIQCPNCHAPYRRVGRGGNRKMERNSPGRVVVRPAWSIVGALAVPNTRARYAAFVQPDTKVGDWTIYRFDAIPLPGIKAGDDVSLDIYGEVTDDLAGLTSFFQVVVAVAAIDYYGAVNPLLYTVDTTRSNGLTRINIGGIVPGHWRATLGPGKMPANPITVAVEVFANHDNNASWNWGLWDQSPWQI